MAVPKWAIAVVCAVGVCGLVLVTLLGLGIHAVTSHVDVDRAPSEADVDARFGSVQARFAGTAPLLTFATGNTQVEHHRRATRSPVVPETLHVMAWDPDEDRLLTVTLPFWLLRLGDDDHVELDLDDESIDLDLTVDDLDHHGPGLVVNYVGASRERLLVWSE